MSRKRSKQTLPSGVEDEPIGRTLTNLGFDPGSSVLNYLTYRIVEDALENDFKPPFRLRFTDAKKRLFRVTEIRTRGSELWERSFLEGSGKVCFPLRCSLTAQNGRIHGIVISTEEMKGWMETAKVTGSHIRFPLKPREFSPEVYSAAVEMLFAFGDEGIEPPFTVEVWDGQGRLFAHTRVHVDSKGEYRAASGFMYCSHLSFPVILRMTAKNGREFTQTIHRQQ